MFLRINPQAATLCMRFEGTDIIAAEGESVASALLAAGILAVRDTPVGSTSRAPFCLMGVCFDCLVEIDGVPNRQSCLTSVRDGMIITRQRGARAAP
ncbi:MAG: (2Fe-2S)-binding protein [Acetobacteraceae bacterium]|nr:(2Fe-2S)-binding protein [Acetobacteraceae bacterium]